MGTDTDETLRITFRLNHATVEELKKHCDEIELKPSQVVRIALKQYLDQVRSATGETKPMRQRRRQLPAK